MLKDDSTQNLSLSFWRFLKPKSVLLYSLCVCYNGYVFLSLLILFLERVFWTDPNRKFQKKNIFQT